MEPLQVWVVDDSELVLDSTRAVLESAGLGVRAHASARDFLSTFQRHDPGILLLDHHMPDMTGLELLQALRGQGVHLPAFIITGLDSAMLEEQARNAGAAGVLRKPVDSDELIAAIRAAAAAQGARA
jgi:FixJ family two-component response regulator